MQPSEENDERVMSLAAAALRMRAGERQEFLRAACADHPDLLAGVSDVMQWEERMGNFLQEPFIDLIDFEQLDPETQVFNSGQTVAGRFFIMGEVGQGGMGIVYEAFDRKRNQRIAIKCAKPGFGRLLSPELEGALRVRHPNICLVNEIHTTETSQGEIDFLTMEFLEGETLAAHLERGTTLSPDEALTIARQLSAGMAAAHDAGILHRDLKTGNVILTKLEDGNPRAVITDFGLATDARFEIYLAGGTPGYMAPELWRGEKPRQASDVYALGVILYEMVTGTKPAHPNAEETLPSLRPPSSIRKDVDTRWDKTILACLESIPENRPTAGRILHEFEKRPIWRSPLLATSVLSLIAIVAGFQRPIMDLFRPADIRLAILPLEAPRELEELGNGVLQDVTERLRRAYPANATLVIIPPSETGQNQIADSESAKRVLHATHALHLRLSRFQDQLVADEALIELGTQTHVRDFKANYTHTTQHSMPEALTGVVTSGLRLQHRSGYGISEQATAPYDRGLYFLNRDESGFDSAIPLFREAIQSDPQSPMARAGLVEALLQKFRATNAPQWMREAEQALSEAMALDPDCVPVLLAGGRIQAAKERPLKALSYYSRVEELEPRNVEVRLRMAAIYNQQDMLEESKKSYREAIAQDAAYYGSYEQFGRFFYAHGEYSSAAEQFRNAVLRAPGLYDLYTDLGAALNEIGRDDEAEQTLLASLEIRATSRALNSLGAIKVYQGQDEQAIQYYRRSLELNPSSFICLLNLADASRRLGHTSEAKAYYLSGLEKANSELSENPASGFTRAYVASFYAHLGNRVRALGEMRQALNLAPTDSRVKRRAVLTYAALGEKDLALEHLKALPKEVVRELDRHPDMAELRRDSHFIDLIETAPKGGTN